LETQLSSQQFRFDKKGTYGGGPLYEVTKGDFKRYVILAPGKDEQGDITAIIVLQDYPG
jgi:restriction endonuclease S subunit